MKVLSIGSDRNLFKKDSDAQKRIKDYGKLFDELHIIVFADGNLGHSDMKLSDNIFIYPTNHKYRFLYLFNIFRIVKGIIRNSLFNIHNSAVTSQDPFESGLAAWLMSRWLKLPLHIQIHTDIFSPYFIRESFSNRLKVLLAKFLLPRANRIRVVSERIKSSLSTFDPRLSDKIIVLPVFVDIKKIQNAKIKTDLHKKYPDNDFIILMASRLTKEKNIGMAMEAMLEIFKKHPKSMLLIVGDGPELENLKVKCQRLNVGDNITFEPWSGELVSYYKTADLFLLTSNYEGYGRTVIEAMAAGLPVVMADVGLAGEILVDDLDGSVFPVDDMVSLVDSILLLMSDKDRREGFVKNAIKTVNSLSSKEEYMNLYKKSLSIDNVIT